MALYSAAELSQHHAFGMRPDPVTSLQLPLDTRTGLCSTTLYPAKLPGATVETPAHPSAIARHQKILLDDSLKKTSSCSEDVLMTDFPCNTLGFSDFSVLGIL